MAGNKTRAIGKDRQIKYSAQRSKHVRVYIAGSSARLQQFALTSQNENVTRVNSAFDLVHYFSLCFARSVQTAVTVIEWRAFAPYPPQGCSVAYYNLPSFTHADTHL